MSTKDDPEIAYVPATPMVSTTAPPPAAADPRASGQGQGGSGVATGTAEEWEATFGPRRKWRYGICECFDIFCFTPLCLMSCCGWTHTLVMGQLMERMGLNWCGMYDPSQAHNTCKTVTIIWVVYLCLYFLGLSIFVWPIMFIYLIILGVRLRGAVRDRFSIPTEYCHCCQGSLEDCLCTSCCSCCAAIQMARQTHDERKYPYNFSANTGLPMYAPVIFEHPMPPPSAAAPMDGRGSANAPPPPPTAATPGLPPPAEGAMVPYSKQS